MAAGFDMEPVVGFAREGDRLFSLGVEAHGEDAIRVDSLERRADYWISTPSALRAVTNVRGVPADNLLDGVDGDFVIIASPEFLPAMADESHPLNLYLDERRAKGWRPVYV